MDNNLELKLVNLRKVLGKGDIPEIARIANVSEPTVRNMFKAKKLSDLKPAMRIALEATISFTQEKKKRDEKTLAKLMDV